MTFNSILVQTWWFSGALTWFNIKSQAKTSVFTPSKTSDLLHSSLMLTFLSNLSSGGENSTIHRHLLLPGNLRFLPQLLSYIYHDNSGHHFWSIRRWPCFLLSLDCSTCLHHSSFNFFWSWLFLLGIDPCSQCYWKTNNKSLLSDTLLFPPFPL